MDADLSADRIEHRVLDHQQVGLALELTLDCRVDQVVKQGDQALALSADLDRVIGKRHDVLRSSVDGGRVADVSDPRIGAVDGDERRRM
ncbi:hypothetical protein [Streptomyces shenzhenensis]|uniref:hypothetical protein n=1 Tax=Streptomyces shenzhenensis TaxID=943815 RepID=UPI0033F47F66